MMVRNRAENATTWDLDKLTAILIRQFKRPLADRGITPTENHIQAIAHAAAQRQPLDADALKLREAMADVVRESLDVLAAWGMSYRESLATGMDQMPGWESTADFLMLANEKGNAELRVSAGASLLALLGDTQFSDLLIACYAHGMDDPEDVDAVIARRALSFAADLDAHAANWLEQAQRWQESNSETPRRP